MEWNETSMPGAEKSSPGPTIMDTQLSFLDIVTKQQHLSTTFTLKLTLHLPLLIDAKSYAQ